VKTSGDSKKSGKNAGQVAIHMQHYVLPSIVAMVYLRAALSSSWRQVFLEASLSGGYLLAGIYCLPGGKRVFLKQTCVFRLEAALQGWAIAQHIFQQGHYFLQVLVGSAIWPCIGLSLALPRLLNDPASEQGLLTELALGPVSVWSHAGGSPSSAPHLEIANLYF
jgi:hypothetical protein